MISPVSFKLFNTKSNNKQTVRNAHVNMSYSKDTVSFKSLKNMLQVNFDELEKTVKYDIEPFMADSRDLYMSVGKLGYDTQETLKIFHQKESDLMNLKIDKTNQDSNPYTAKYKKYSVPFNEYTSNLREYNGYLQTSKLEMYDTPELHSKLNKASALYKENPEIEKIKPLMLMEKEAFNEIDTEFEKIKLENSNKNLFEKLRNLREQLTGAQYYMVVTPYNDAVKLKMAAEDISKSLSNPKISPLTKLDNIERANNTAYKILETKKLFYKNKESMKKFVQESKDNVLPSQAEIESAYGKLNKSCETVYKNTFEKVSDFYQREYVGKKSSVNLKSLSMTIKEQKKANSEIQQIINKIKQDFITKQNEEVMKKWNLDDINVD